MEIWQSYEGDKIIRKESNGREMHKINGNEVYYRTHDGKEIFAEYTEFNKIKSSIKKDENGNIISTYEFIYDDENRLIEQKHSDGRNLKIRYEGNRKYIDFTSKDGKVINEIYEYDQKGNNIFFSTNEDEE